MEIHPSPDRVQFGVVMLVSLLWLGCSSVFSNGFRSISKWFISRRVWQDSLL